MDLPESSWVKIPRKPMMRGGWAVTGTRAGPVDTLDKCVWVQCINPPEVIN